MISQRSTVVAVGLSFFVNNPQYLLRGCPMPAYRTSVQYTNNSLWLGCVFAQLLRETPQIGSKVIMFPQML